MAKGAITSEGSGGENIQHFSTIRIRATGQGNLKLAVHSLDFIETRTKYLLSLPLEARTRIQPNRIVNYVEQRACFELFTTDINEYVRINRIIVFMKEIYTSHPGA